MVVSLRRAYAHKTIKFKEMQNRFTSLLENNLVVAANIRKNVFAFYVYVLFATILLERSRIDNIH